MSRTAGTVTSTNSTRRNPVAGSPANRQAMLGAQRSRGMT
jgi:hypothetical protein